TPVCRDRLRQGRVSPRYLSIHPVRHRWHRSTSRSRARTARVDAPSPRTVTGPIQLMPLFPAPGTAAKESPLSGDRQTIIFRTSPSPPVEDRTKLLCVEECIHHEPEPRERALPWAGYLNPFSQSSNPLR